MRSMQRMRARRSLGDLRAMWCAPVGARQPVAGQIRALKDCLKAILKDAPRPLDSTTEIRYGVRKRVAK